MPIVSARIAPDRRNRADPQAGEDSVPERGLAEDIAQPGEAIDEDRSRARESE